MKPELPPAIGPDISMDAAVCLVADACHCKPEDVSIKTQFIVMAPVKGEHGLTCISAKSRLLRQAVSQLVMQAEVRERHG